MFRQHCTNRRVVSFIQRQWDGFCRYGYFFFSLKLDSRFFTEDRLITSSEFSSQGRLRQSCSNATQSTSQWVFGEFITEVGCSTASETVFPMVRVFCVSDVGNEYQKSLFGETCAIKVPTEYRLLSKNVLIGQTTISPACFMLMVTNVCD